MQQRVIVTKIKWNKGKTDDGTEYDYTRVSVQMPIYEHSSNEFGVDIVDCEYGTESQHIDLLPLKGKLPCEVECVISQAMKRGKLVNVIGAIRPASKPEAK